ncbi:unnamed protein product, partial [Amoebophrya sp. A25]|eukprot:GSA25T00019894001.1
MPRTNAADHASSSHTFGLTKKTLLRSKVADLYRRRCDLLCVADLLRRTREVLANPTEVHVKRMLWHVQPFPFSISFQVLASSD